MTELEEWLCKKFQQQDAAYEPVIIYVGKLKELLSPLRPSWHLISNSEVYTTAGICAVYWHKLSVL